MKDKMKAPASDITPVPPIEEPHSPVPEREPVTPNPYPVTDPAVDPKPDPHPEPEPFPIPPEPIPQYPPDVTFSN
jgi:hypothetical protein